MPHVTHIRARFADLDPYDHVNHAHYLTYFESARIEMLDEMGFGMDVMKTNGFQIVLVELTARYLAPTTLHDDITITTTVGAVGRAVSRWHQEATVGDQTVAILEVRAGFTDRNGRPVRAPEGFAAAAARFV